MAEYQIVHVAIMPPSNLESDLIEKVAAIVNKGTYDTRLLMTGGIPRIIAHCQSIPAAESMASSLRELGLVAFLCKDSELHRPAQSFRAHTLEIREREVLFWDKGGRDRRLESGDVFLILKGREQTYIEEEEAKAKMKFSLPMTMLTGGIPIWRRVKEQTSVQSQRSEYFLRLYDRKSSEDSVDILQGHVNYSFLGTEMTYSSLTNFSTLSAKLQGVFPQAIFDDRLTGSLAVTTPSGTGPDVLEVKLRLIYMCYAAQSGLNC
jgi:hypothetical protein